MSIHTRDCYLATKGVESSHAGPGAEAEERSRGGEGGVGRYLQGPRHCCILLVANALLRVQNLIQFPGIGCVQLAELRTEIPAHVLHGQSKSNHY